MKKYFFIVIYYRAGLMSAEVIRCNIRNRIMEEKSEISLVNKATPQHGDKVS